MQKLAVVYFLNINSEEINNIRKSYDPQWNIIDPHITVVFPFSDSTVNQIGKEIHTIIQDRSSFQIHLNGLMKSFDNYLFLLVKEGNEKIVALHDTLYSGILASYRQVTIPFIPHITLGLFENKNSMHTASYDAVYKVAEKIDIRCTFDSVTLIKGDGQTPPEIIQKFNLK